MDWHLILIAMLSTSKHCFNEVFHLHILLITIIAIHTHTYTQITNSHSAKSLANAFIALSKVESSSMQWTQVNVFLLFALAQIHNKTCPIPNRTGMQLIYSAALFNSILNVE